MTEQLELLESCNQGSRYFDSVPLPAWYSTGSVLGYELVPIF
jgi:hypothetical protein